MKLKIYLVLGLILFSIGAIVAIDTTTTSEASINIFKIIYDTFDSSTTNFDSLNKTQVMNMSGVVLEKSSFGKVEFLENLNLFDMKNATLTVDFDSNLEISDNLINVDEYILSGINKRAKLTLQGISLTDPVIYNKGVVCSNCALISYVGDVYVFNTTLFEGPYYLREAEVPPVCGDDVCEDPETEVTCPSDCTVSPPSSGGGGGGGGDGGGVEASEDDEVQPDGIYNFTIFPTLIESTIRKGSYFQKKVAVKNTGDMELVIAIVVEELKEYVFPEDKSFKIKPGEIKNIRIDIYVSDGVEADVHLGKIKFISKYVSRSADFVLFIKNKDALFDIRTTMLKKYVNPGGRARANISLINMGDLRNFDVSLEYKILDFNRNEYTVKEEQFAIDVIHSNVYFLDTPSDMPIGNYIFYSTVRYRDIYATSYDVFTIEKISYISWLILILIILILIYITIRWYRERKRQLAEETRKRSMINKSKKKTKVKKTHVEEEIELLP